jgi:amidase
MTASKLLPTALSLLSLGLTAQALDAYNNDSSLLVQSQIVENPFPYDFPENNSSGTGSSALFPMRLCNGFRLEEASVDDIQAQLSSGKFTSVQLLQCYYDRIYQTDSYLKYG